MYLANVWKGNIVGLRLLALDMDGTLLTSEKTVSDATWAALGRLADKGVTLALCTGRNALEARWSLEGRQVPSATASLRRVRSRMTSGRETSSMPIQSMLLLPFGSCVLPRQKMRWR